MILINSYPNHLSFSNFCCPLKKKEMRGESRKKELWFAILHILFTWFASPPLKRLRESPNQIVPQHLVNKQQQALATLAKWFFGRRRRLWATNKRFIKITPIIKLSQNLQSLHNDARWTFDDLLNKFHDLYTFDDGPIFSPDFHAHSISTLKSWCVLLFVMRKAHQQH